MIASLDGISGKERKMIRFQAVSRECLWNKTLKHHPQANGVRETKAKPEGATSNDIGSGLSPPLSS